LDDALKGKTRLTKITFDDVGAMPQLKELLVADGTGQANVHVIVPLNDNECAELEIKGDYALSNATVNAVRNLNGVIGYDYTGFIFDANWWSDSNW